MIHQYKLNGYNIVLDICSGAVHAVDDIAYDIISVYEAQSKEETLRPYIGFSRHQKPAESKIRLE